MRIEGKPRHVGIDVLRIMAMLGIILFHHIGTNYPKEFVQLPFGFTDKSFFYDAACNAAGCVLKSSLLMDFCYAHLGCGGNFIFMLVTGYFLFGRASTFRKRTRTVAKVLLALIIYGVLLTIVGFAMLVVVWPRIGPTSVDPTFTLPNWLSGENRWYLQCYGIFILVVLPLLKLFEDRLTRETHGCLCVGLVAVNLLAYQTYLPSLPLSQYLVYFIMCYYIGGYIRMYGVRFSLGQLVAMLAAYVVAYVLYDYYWRFSNMTLHAPHEYSFSKLMVPIQPFICCITFALLCFAIATKVRIVPSSLPSKALSRVATTTIGIYIFHITLLKYSFVIANRFWWHDWSAKGLLLFSVLDTFLLFAICCIIELMRQRIGSVIITRAARKPNATTSHTEHPAEAASVNRLPPQ